MTPLCTALDDMTRSMAQDGSKLVFVGGNWKLCIHIAGRRRACPRPCARLRRLIGPAIEGEAPGRDQIRSGGATYAWDKPGVGDSAGDWLAQSMQDRAGEAVAAYRAVAARPEARAVGFVGFSQAGWVAPQAAAVDPSFTLLIGAAVSWRDQAAYFTQQRLVAEGVSAQQAVRRSLAQQEVEDAALRGDAPDPAAFPGMDARRLGFVHRNYRADSTAALGRMRGPVLALWGARDRNTDPARNLARFRQALPPSAQLAIMPSATHSLLDAERFDYQTPDAWPWHARLAYLAMGRAAYADGALARITGWIADAATRRAARTETP